ncbi:MAG: hypothetical protein ACK4TH_11605, partial [Tepidimonas sp.]
MMDQSTAPLDPSARTTLLQALRAAVGQAHVLTCADTDLEAWERDWRRRHRGRALAVVRPGSTDEVAAVVRTCAAHGTPIVPQGWAFCTSSASVRRPSNSARLST